MTCRLTPPCSGRHPGELGTSLSFGLERQWRWRRIGRRFYQWRSFAPGPYARQDAGGTTFHYGAREIREKLTNLGEMRRDAAKAR